MVTGGNNTISFFNEDINLQNTENYHLSIEISPKNVSYCLLHSKDLEYFYFKNINLSDGLSTIDVLSSEETLKQQFSSSSISYKNFPSTIIPNELYDEKSKDKYLEFVTEHKDCIKSEIIHQIDSTIVYSIDGNIENIINQIQPNISEINSTKISICELIKQYGNLNKKISFIFIEESNIEIIVIDKSNLIFQNQFNIDNNTDILYYTLFCFNQLGLDTESNELIMYGDISKGDEKHSLLYDYIRNIHFGQINDSLLFNPKLIKVSRHQYFSLFSQLLCV